MVADVATLEPEQAAKMAQEAILVWISPPGRKEIQRETAPYIFSPMPLRSINSPIKRNSGTAIKMKFVFVSHALFPMMFQRGASEKTYIKTSDKTPRAPAT